MSRPVVFEDLSHVYTSNDGVVAVERIAGGETDGGLWCVFTRNGRDTKDRILVSESRDVCEAFILGWDARS